MIRLPPPQVLDIRGPDAAAFAHAQFSSDVRALAAGHWQWSAWLSAQGRVRALFHLLRIGDDAFRLVLRGGTAEELRGLLSPFVLRAKVRLEAVAVPLAVGCFDEAAARMLAGAVPSGRRVIVAAECTAIAVDGGVPRWLLFGEHAGMAAGDEAPDRWRAADIDAGLAELAPDQLDRFVPAALGLGRFGAVSVGKGCYPGQEIVARLHFKGGNKRWLHRLEFTALELPRPGLELGAGSEPPGELLQAAWTDAPHGVALAVLPELGGRTQLTSSTSVANFRVVSAIRDASA